MTAILAGGRLLDTKLQEIRIGFQIAPVTLNTRGKSVRLVGLGSYIVNAQGGCNDCHTHPSYAAGGNPHLGQPEVINARAVPERRHAVRPLQVRRTSRPTPTAAPPASPTTSSRP